MSKDETKSLPAPRSWVGNLLVKKLNRENKLAEVYKMIEQGSYSACAHLTRICSAYSRKETISMEEARDKSTNPDDLLLQLKGIERGANN